MGKMVKEQMQMVKMVAGNVSLLHYQLDYGILHEPYVYRMRIFDLLFAED